MNRPGFTLIEIIIVIVILGVLATLALPRLAMQIDASESAEAMQFFGVVKRAAMACYDAMESFSGCTDQAHLGVAIPNGGRFSYFQNSPGPGSAEGIWWARAIRNTGNYIMMTVDNTGLTRFATDTGPFGGIVKKTGSTTASIAIGANPVY